LPTPRRMYTTLHHASSMKLMINLAVILHLVGSPYGRTNHRSQCKRVVAVRSLLAFRSARQTPCQVSNVLHEICVRFEWLCVGLTSRAPINRKRQNGTPHPSLRKNAAESCVCRRQQKRLVPQLLRKARFIPHNLAFLRLVFVACKVSTTINRVELDSR